MVQISILISPSPGHHQRHPPACPAALPPPDRPHQCCRRFVWYHFRLSQGRTTHYTPVDRLVAFNQGRWRHLAQGANCPPQPCNSGQVGILPIAKNAETDETIAGHPPAHGVVATLLAEYRELHLDAGLASLFLNIMFRRAVTVPAGNIGSVVTTERI